MPSGDRHGQHAGRVFGETVDLLPRRQAPAPAAICPAPARELCFRRNRVRAPPQGTPADARASRLEVRPQHCQPARDRPDRGELFHPLCGPRFHLANSHRRGDRPHRRPAAARRLHLHHRRQGRARVRGAVRRRPLGGLERLRIRRAEAAARAAGGRPAAAGGAAPAAGGGALARRRAGAGRPRPGGGSGLEPAAALSLHHRPAARQRPAARPLHRPAPPALVAAAADAGLGQPPSRRRHGPGTARRRHRLGMAEPPAATQHAARPPRPVAADLARRPGAGRHVRQPRPDRPAALPLLARGAPPHSAIHPGNAAAGRLRPGSAVRRRPRLRRRRPDGLDGRPPIPPIPPLGNRSSGRPWPGSATGPSAACWTGCRSC